MPRFRRQIASRRWRRSTIEARDAFLPQAARSSSTSACLNDPARVASPRWRGSRFVICKGGRLSDWRPIHRHRPRALDCGRRAARESGNGCRIGSRRASAAPLALAPPTHQARQQQHASDERPPASADTGRCEDAPVPFADRQRVAHLRLGQRAEDHARPPPARSESRSAASPRRAGRCAYSSNEVERRSGACRTRRRSRRSGCRRRAAASGSSAA